MLTIEKLKEYGADTETGVARCLGAEDFYLELVNSVLPDTKLDELGAALKANDLDQAFDIAHALKGMYGNIAITPIFEPVNEMTELLRSRTQTDYSALLSKALAQKEKLVALAD